MTRKRARCTSRYLNYSLCGRRMSSIKSFYGTTFSRFGNLRIDISRFRHWQAVFGCFVQDYYCSVWTIGFPTFQIVSNPVIKLSEIKERRFVIVDNA